MPESLQRQRRAEIAALLLDMYDGAGSTRLRRSDVLARWVAAYPEQTTTRSGSRHGPGTQAGHVVRRGLAEWERSGALRRAGEHVLLLDIGALEAAADR